MRTVRVGRRARALAVSWPPYDGKRCTTAPDGRYRLRVIARDVPGNTRAIDLGDDHGARRRALAARPLDRRRAGACASASRPTRAACGSISRGSGGAPAVLARGTHAPGGDRARPGRPRAAASTSSATATPGAPPRRCWRCAARSPARVALLLVDGQPASVLAALPAAPGRARHPLRRDHARDLRAGLLDGYTAVVVPPVGGSADPIAGIRSCTTLAGIQPGLGS